MTNDELLAVLEAVRSQTVLPSQALKLLHEGPFRRSELASANIDHHRRLRHGLAEAVYGEAKTVTQLVDIAVECDAARVPVLFTRLSEDKISALQVRFPSARINQLARTCLINPPLILEPGPNTPHVAIVAAGTGDMPVAEEAAEVCIAMGTPFRSIVDVGVAGLHRILSKFEVLQQATALIIVAGMEGALPSVVAGLVGRPIIAVPTSVGYGTNFGGISALLGMLNSCAPGVTVVNIDNGFSAAFAACQIVRQVRESNTSRP